VKIRNTNWIIYSFNYFE